MKGITAVLMASVLVGCSAKPVLVSDPGAANLQDSEVGYVYMHADGGDVWMAHVAELHRNGEPSNLIPKDIWARKSLRLSPGVYTVTAWCKGYEWTAHPMRNVLVTPGSRTNLICKLTEDRKKARLDMNRVEG